MFERFTDRARRVIVLAQVEARMLSHDYIGTEHILLGLIQEGQGVAAKALESLGISLPAVRSHVEEIIGRGQSAPSGHIPFTPRAKKILELSLREALQLGHQYIGTEHILLGVIREGEGVAAQVLQKMGADLDGVRHQVLQLLSALAGTAEEPLEPTPPGAEVNVRRAAERARRARELADQLAASTGDPAIKGIDVLYGLLLSEPRLLAMEILASQAEEESEGEPPPAEGPEEAEEGREQSPEQPPGQP